MVYEPQNSAGLSCFKRGHVIFSSRAVARQDNWGGGGGGGGGAGGRGGGGGGGGGCIFIYSIHVHIPQKQPL
jgi:hypothetical protein